MRIQAIAYTFFEEFKSSRLIPIQHLFVLQLIDYTFNDLTNRVTTVLSS